MRAAPRGAPAPETRRTRKTAREIASHETPRPRPARRRAPRGRPPRGARRPRPRQGGRPGALHAHHRPVSEPEARRRLGARIQGALRHGPTSRRARRRLPGALDAREGRRREAGLHRQGKGEGPARPRAVHQGILRHEGPGPLGQGLPRAHHHALQGWQAQRHRLGHREERLRGRAEDAGRAPRGDGRGQGEDRSRGKRRLRARRPAARLRREGLELQRAPRGPGQAHAGGLRQVRARAPRARPAGRHRARGHQGLRLARAPRPGAAARHRALRHLDGGVEPHRRRQALPRGLLLRLRRPRLLRRR